MAFPAIVGSAALTQLTSANPGVVTMPASIVAGELLLVFCAGDTSGTMSQSGGSDWTVIDQGANGTAVQGAIFAKIAAGGDTLSVQFEANDFAAVAIRVDDHGVSAVATDITKGTAATGSSLAPDPPLCDPGVAKDYLWLEHFAADDDDNTSPYVSSNYTAVGQAESAQSASSCMSSVGSRQLNAASENPGPMVMAAIEEWRAQTLAIPPAAAGDFPLDAQPGGYTLSGAVAGVPANRLIDSVPGAYALAGLAAGALAGRVVAADPGAYSLAGSAAGALADRLIASDPGVYAVDGFAATVARELDLAADPGAYVVSGAVATLLAARLLAADSGAYALTGQAAGLLVARLIVADSGAYALTGVAAELVYDAVLGAFVLNAEPGSFAVGGLAAGTLADRLTGADPGAYVLDGAAAGILAARALSADPGSYALAEVLAGLLAARALAADPGTYTLAGVVADLGGVGGVFLLDAAPGAYALIGSQAGLLLIPVDRHGFSSGFKERYREFRSAKERW